MKISSILANQIYTQEQAPKNLAQSLDMVNFNGKEGRASIKKEHIQHMLYNRRSKAENEPQEDKIDQEKLEKLLSINNEEEYKQEFKKIMEEDESFPNVLIPGVIANLKDVNKDIAAKIVLDKNFPRKSISTVLLFTNEKNRDFTNFLISDKDFPKSYVQLAIRFANEKNIGAKKEMLDLVKKHKEELGDDYQEVLGDYVAYTDEINLDVARKMFLDPKFSNRQAWAILQMIYSDNIKMVEDMLNNPDFPNNYIACVLDSEKPQKDKESIETILQITKNKKEISELTIQEREKLLKHFISLNRSLFVDNDEFRQKFPLIPKNQEEYCMFLSTIAHSMEVEKKQLNEDEISELNKDLIKLGNTIKDFDFSPYAKYGEIKRQKNIVQEFPTSNFIQVAKKITEDLSQNEQSEVFNYYGFKTINVINQNDETIETMKGYVINPSDENKISNIKNGKVREKIEELRPYVLKYTQNNRITVEGNKELENALNSIVEKIPQLHTIIGREQHKTQNFTIDVHSLKVMQGIVNNPKFEELSSSDKKVMLLGALFHDISKTEQLVDKAHPQESAFDTLNISMGLGLDKTEQTKLYDLIKNHSYLENINKTDGKEKERAINKVAFDLRFENTYELEEIFTEADLRAVKEDGFFYRKYGSEIAKNSSIIKEKIRTIQKSQPLMPISKIPKASQIKDGEGVYRTSDGKVLIKLNEVSDFEKIGFQKGTNSQNLKFLVHGLSALSQVSMLESLSTIDSKALLSTSYVADYKNEYHVFRPKGLVLECDTKDIIGGKEKGGGSGNKKITDDFIENYLYCSTETNWRNYYPSTVKKELNLSDDEYIELVHKYQNKSFSEIEQEDMDFANALRRVYENIKTEKRYYGKKYNEVLTMNPKISGVFIYNDMNGDKIGNPIDFINRDDIGGQYEFICDWAQENDLPILVFGD